jgi:hypothetical protein
VRRGATRQHLRRDALGAPRHLGGGAPREGQEHDPPRIDAVEDEMRDAMRQRVGLAGAGAGQDQERPGRAEIRPAIFDGTTLLEIELREVGNGHRCVWDACAGCCDDKSAVAALRTVGPMAAAPLCDSDLSTRTDTERKDKFARSY